jgi:hypothetical protein
MPVVTELPTTKAQQLMFPGWSAMRPNRGCRVDQRHLHHADSNPHAPVVTFGLRRIPFVHYETFDRGGRRAFASSVYRAFRDFCLGDLERDLWNWSGRSGVAPPLVPATGHAAAGQWGCTCCNGARRSTSAS